MLNHALDEYEVWRRLHTAEVAEDHFYNGLEEEAAVSKRLLHWFGGDTFDGAEHGCTDPVFHAAEHTLSEHQKSLDEIYAYQWKEKTEWLDETFLYSRSTLDKDEFM